MVDAGTTADLTATYRGTVERYVRTGEEQHLETAYTLGREAFSQGVTILTLVDLHRTCVRELADPAGDGDAAAAATVAERVDASFQILAEILTMYEMTHRGYSDARERARSQEQQAELHDRLNRAYLQVDQAPPTLDQRVAAIERAAAALTGLPSRCDLADRPDEPAGRGGTGDRADPPGPRFPIRNPDGETVATLAVELAGDQTLAEDQRYLLTEFCNMAGATVEHGRLYDHQRWIGRHLQLDLLPRRTEAPAGVDVAYRYLPGEGGTDAGGDWYDVFELAGGRVGLVVGDVNGHGVASVATMGQLRTGVLAYALAGFEPPRVVEHVDMLLQRMRASTIATLVYVVADRDEGAVTLVNAGHPPPVLLDPDRRAHMVNGHGRLLGVSSTRYQRRSHRVDLKPGGHLLLYTDGLVEPIDRAGGDGLAALREATGGFSGTVDELCDHVLHEMAPDGARDDICLMAIGLEA